MTLRRPALMRLSEIVVSLLLGYAAVMAFFGFVSLSLRAAGVDHRLVQVAASGALLMALVAVWFLRHMLTERLVSVLDRLARWPSNSWWFACVGTGLALRLAWVFIVDSHPSSDGATYLNLAKGLLAGQDYRAGGTLAYWPPGYPLFLVPWLAALGSDRIAIVVSNLVLFLVAMLGVRALARQTGDAGVERMALLLVALWPNLIAQSVTPEKEQLLVALIPWVLCTAVAATRAPHLLAAVAWAGACGLALGAANLVQPAFLLFPFVLTAFWVLTTRRARNVLMLGLALIVGASAIISPWSLRNLRVLDHFVLISTNGGIGLYGANNPRAGGGYYEYWAEDDLTKMDELSADREGRRRAMAWIRSHPGDALRLAFEKNLRFMGDDAVGVYQSLKRGGGTDNPLVYAATKLFANAFWLGFWLVMLAAIFLPRRRDSQLIEVHLLVSAAFLYGFALHSLAESAGKYHVYATAALCVLLPLTLRMAELRASTMPDHGGSNE